MRGPRLLVALLLGLVPATASAQSERVEYYALDAVGSVRVVFDATGAVVGRMDYAPFGEELFNGLFVPAERFAELKRDVEAGLDYAQARLYQPRTGRFNAPDPVLAGLSDPQRWNRYGYALNRPLTMVDSSGLLAAGPSSFCSAEHSFQGCGGSGLFWADTFGGGGGGIGFGNSYADAVKRGYVPGMPDDVWAGLDSFNQRVDDAVLKNFVERAETQTTEGVVANIGLIKLGEAITRLAPRAQVVLQSLMRLIGSGSQFDQARQALLNNPQAVGSAAAKGADLYHKAAASPLIQQMAAAQGTYFKIVDASGRTNTLIQVPGMVNNAAGRFEYIVNTSGQLTHQFFVAGGRINGIPIRP